MERWKWITVLFYFMAPLSAQGSPLPEGTHPDGAEETSKVRAQTPEGSFYLETFDQLPKQPPLPEKEQRLRIGIQVGFISEMDIFKFVNPYTAIHVPHMLVNINIFEGLVVSNGLQVVPGLASEWEYSPDLMQWRFKIRPEARWSDGSELRAQDFVLGFQTLCDPMTYTKEFFEAPLTTARRAVQRVPIRNAMDVFEGRSSVEQLGVYAEDDKTLCFELERPILPDLLLTSLTGHHFYPMRSEHIEIFREKNESRYAQIPACGAFSLRGAQFPNNIYLKKNRFYWDQEQISLQEVVVVLRREFSMLKELWEGGEIDLYKVDRDQVRLSKQQKAHLWNIRYSGFDGIGLNLRNRWLSNKKVRQALNLLFDRERIIQAFLFEDTRTPLFGLLPPDSKVVQGAGTLKNPKDTIWKHWPEERIEKARRLLCEGIEEKLAEESAQNYGEGSNLNKADLAMKPKETGINLTLQHAYETTMSAVGLLHHDLNLLPDLLAVKLQHIELFPKYPQDMQFQGFFHLPHPFYRFSLFRTMEGPEGKRQENIYGFHNQEYNEVLEALESGTGMPHDADEAAKWIDKQLCRLDQIIREEVPFLPWREAMIQYVVHPEVGGLPRADYPESDSTHHFSGALYFKHLFIREPYDRQEHRRYSPNTHRKQRYFGIKPIKSE